MRESDEPYFGASPRQPICNLIAWVSPSLSGEPAADRMLWCIMPHMYMLPLTLQHLSLTCTVIPSLLLGCSACEICAPIKPHANRGP